jgi:hypothetical protein
VEALRGGQWYTVDPFDAVCGNVHFTPTAACGYDHGNPTSVLSTCKGYGRHAGTGGADLAELVSSAKWTGYESLAPDCQGSFLVWWWQNMPGYGTAQTFTDARLMKSVWPFLYY